jgi:GAF domain-containing protein/anti-sigma regulatory factor (Ser/Thr protein kinase)
MTPADRLRQLAQLARAVVSELDLETVLSQVTAALRSLRPDAVCAIRLVDADAGGYRLVGTEGVPAAERTLVVPFGEGLTHVVAETRRPLLVEDNQTDPRAVPRHWSKRSGLTTYYGLPIEAAGELLGVVNMNFPPDAPPTEEEQASIEVLAAQAAVAIRNARLFAEREERRRAAEALAKVSRALAQTLDADVIAQQVADTVRDLLRARGSFLFQVRSAAEDLVTVAVSGEVGPDFDRGRVVPGGSGLAGVAIRTKHVVVTPDFLIDARVVLPPEWRRRLEPATDRAVLAAPLIVQDRVIGALSIRDRTGRVFSDQDRALARAFADQAAVALENARLYSETERRRREAEELARIARTLADSLDETVVADRIVQSVLPLFGVHSAILRRLRPDGALVAISVAGRARDHFDSGHVMPPGVGLVGRAVAEGRAIIGDVVDEPDVVLNDDLRRRVVSAEIRAMLAVPLRVRGETLGVLALGDAGPRTFSAAEVTLLETFADQAALALHNAQVLKESQARRAQLEALLEVTRELSAIQSVESLLEMIAKTCGRLLDSESVGFRLLEGDDLVVTGTWGDAAKIMAVPRLKIGESLSGIVAATGEPLVVDDYANDPRVIPAQRDAIRRASHKHWLGVPVKIGGRLIGVLSIRTRRDPGFSERDVALATAFAAQAAIALETARLYTDAKHAYEELSRAQTQMVRVETLRAVGELAAGASHHLNNLLAVVLGRLQLALLKFDDPDLHKQLVPAERAVQDGANVVARLLRFSRGQTAPTFVSVDLNELAGDVIELTRPRWQNELLAKGIAVDIRLEPGAIPEIAGDPPSLREVVMNLILNAVDALPSGGRITITTWADAGSVYCRVADTGIGMSPAVQQRALEPFFTTKGVKSTGLGLSANYGILQRHSGELTIESVEGQGTRVTFRLPAGRSVNESQIPAPPVSAPPLRILLVDDESDVRAVITDMLAGDGHEVLASTNGADGLAQFLGDPSLDLVLTDLGMPGMTGWELAQAVKASRPSLPVGIITGWGDAPEATPEERAWVDFVLAKPITQGALRSAVAHTRLPRGVP